MRQYNLVSADDHVHEPGDLWTRRVPAKFRDRVPRVERGPDGDAWVIEGRRGRTFGMEVQGGRKFEHYKQEGETYDSVRKGTWDPVERLKDMDLDGIDAEVIFPNLGIGPLFLLEDLDLQFACLRAYNDFLSEWCSTDPSRLAGIALITTDNVETGVAELERVAKLPAIRGAMVPTYPRHEPLNSDVYDPLWATAEDLGLPMHIHLRTGDRRTEGLFQSNAHLRGNPDVILNLASLANYEALSRIIFGGVLENFPRLKVVSVEGNVGWLGYFLEKSDRTYKRHRHHTGLKLPNPPSFYFHRQVLATFIEDKVGVQIRNTIGVDSLMWAADYPHTDTTFPNSRRYLDEHFAGVPAEDRYKIVAGNAVKLYGLA